MGQRTCAQAGARLGVKRNAYYRYEMGHRKVPAERARAWAQIIGCDPAELRPDIFGEIKPLAA